MRKGTEDDVGVRKVGLALLGLVRQIEVCYAQSAHLTGLHATDFRAICVLSDAERAMSPKELGDILGLTSGAVSALITRLETHEFITRSPNPSDRRGVLLTLNEAAVAEPLKRYHALHQFHTQATDDLSSSELDAIFRYLERIRDVTARHCEEKDLKAPAGA